MHQHAGAMSRVQSILSDVKVKSSQNFACARSCLAREPISLGLMPSPELFLVRSYVILVVGASTFQPFFAVVKLKPPLHHRLSEFGGIGFGSGSHAERRRHPSLSGHAGSSLAAGFADDGSDVHAVHESCRSHASTRTTARRQRRHQLAVLSAVPGRVQWCEGWLHESQ